MTPSNDRPTRARRTDFATDYAPPAAAVGGADLYDDVSGHGGTAAGVQAAGPLTPLQYAASGLYERSSLLPPLPTPVPTPATQLQGALDEEARDAADAAAAADASLNILRETVRLDVDGRYPQMAVSGTIYQYLTERTHWIARLALQGDGSWTGAIFYKDGNTASFPYTRVKVTAVRTPFPTSRSVTVTFSGGGTATLMRTYRWSSGYFRPCDFEYDTVAGATAVTSIQTHAHPRRPTALPSETLTIEKVYQRAGFNVTRAGDGPIPVVNAGPDGRWSTAEMHDAMQRYWSKFADRPQWAVWTLFASMSDQGASLGGVMFDDLGPNHRQGTAVFSDSFIAQAPTGDANAAAWVKRMRFWTAVHELGHTFNLAHSWQKVHPASWGKSWAPLVNEPEARSFMNYPYNVSGGQSAFFGSFEYRFSDQELLFMRHAPERFVQQGNAEWFANHGFSQVRASETPTCRLELRSTQAEHGVATAATHQFLDQVVVEFKLTNVTDEPMLIEEHILETLDHMTLVVKREGGSARVHVPHATMCWHGRRQVLQPNESRYASLYLSAGRGGFYVAEPGRYVVQAVLHLEGEDVVSNVLQLRVLPPRGYEEEAFAQDLFTTDVGRALAFDGTRALTGAEATLEEAVARFPERAIATHARVAIALPRAGTFKELRDGAGSERLAFEGIDPNYGQSRALLHEALAERPAEAARTLGHIDFADYGARFARSLAEGGDEKAAAAERASVVDGLRERGVRKAVLDRVKAELKEDSAER